MLAFDKNLIGLGNLGGRGLLGVAIAMRILPNIKLTCDSLIANDNAALLYEEVDSVFRLFLQELLYGKPVFNGCTSSTGPLQTRTFTPCAKSIHVNGVVGYRRHDEPKLDREIAFFGK
jgi:hypothetical protein